jgi:hypothetical protein
LCDSHHAAVHEGRIRLSGVAGALMVSHADGRPYGAPPMEASPVVAPPAVPCPESDAALIADVRSALTGLGFRPAEANAAVAKAVAHVGRAVSLEVLIRAALQRCPRPA